MGPSVSPCVGVLTLAGKVPRVLVTPTDDLGQILNSVHGIPMEGTMNFPTGVQVAHLALKHRQNKHQRQGLHPSISQLNLSRVCHKKTPYTP
jgi:Mg-chelatase subunit ChlD